MADVRLDYFDFHGGRGEVTRLIMSIGNIEFDDHRIPLADWPAAKGDCPLRALPVIHIDGEAITQSNSMNRYMGRLAGLYPEDPLAALRCDEIMDGIEDILVKIIPTFRMQDEDEKKAARQQLADGPIPLYLGWLQGLLEKGAGDYFVEDRLTIADLKVFVWIRSLRAGTLDYVPKDIVDTVAPQLVEHCERVASHPGVVAWYEKCGK